MRTLLLILPTILMLVGGGGPTSTRIVDEPPPPVLRTTAANVDTASGGDAPATAGVRYRLPLPGAPQVLRGFDPPRVRYGAGHLGVDLRAGGVAVVAAGEGRVSFAGSVAGRGVVVIVHPDGISTEYEPVRALVHPGQTVTVGQPIGTVAGVHRGCPGRCLHWGARRAGSYLDPMNLLRALGPVRLLPWNGQ